MSVKTCAVVIPSHNRCNDLRLTCQQLRKLSPAPDEIVICLDGCTDGSKEMLSREFPSYQVIENATQQGSIPARDQAFRTLKSDLILSLDDDSYPTDFAFIEKLRTIVEQHPEAGAFAFPEIRNDGKPADPNRAPESPGCYVRDFSNCAAVMLRSLYGTAAEYVPFFSHAYAEPDYCLQLYAGGYAVWFEPALSIRHHFTPKERNMATRHLLNARNELWSVFMRCPFPYVAPVALFRVWRQFQYACSKGLSWVIREPVWWLLALTGIPNCLRHRSPVGWRIYYAWMKLARQPVTSASQLFDKGRVAT